MKNISHSTAQAQAVFDLTTLGKTSAQIVKLLNKQGKGRWTRSRVEEILTDESYAGTLVSEDVWNRAQGIPRSNSLLSGLIECKLCGSGYNLFNDPDSAYRAYKCRRQRKEGNCNNLTINADELESAIWDRIEKYRSRVRAKDLRGKDALRLLRQDDSSLPVRAEIVRRFVPGITIRPDRTKVARARVRVITV